MRFFKLFKRLNFKIKIMIKTSIISLLLLICCNLRAQQVQDTSYNPIIEHPVYKPGQGSVVFIDEGHNNYHSKDGRYSPFAKVLEKDGYVIKAYKGSFEEKSLKEGKILVIANPLNKINVDNWTLPTPSAFTEDEIKTLDKWVKQGGSLILIPKIAWEFNSSTPIKNIEGFSQGAFKKHGNGRIVVFGEASMFSAQIDEGIRKMEMNNENAQDNYKLLLNIIHWLDGILN